MQRIVQINNDSIHLELPFKKTWITWLSILAYVNFIVSPILFAVWMYQNVIGDDIIPEYVQICFISLYAFNAVICLRQLIYMMAGGEIIHIENGMLQFRRKNLFFAYLKTYDLKYISDVTLCKDVDEQFFNTNRYLRMITKLNRYATIQFESGYKEVKLASGLTDAESKVVLEWMLSKKMIEPDQLRPNTEPVIPTNRNPHWN
jgi:hypothetical protein